ncbi:hypothetical protein PPYR_02405 [Photinus pyralis]|uniref:DUF8207 domain-containing protein n=1 Tax=Photinus pyralis TaxID=7054 RepID=A0A5N4B756_PHOPY|nr:hypothetical protein PPYR_02405 [Photinus pyralis]
MRAVKMNAQDQAIKRKLTKTRSEIKRKLAALKRGETETLRLVEETYKPIVDPLKTLAKQELKKQALTPKVENKIEYESTPMQEQFATPRRTENTAVRKRISFPPDISEIALDEEENDEAEETTRSISNLSQLHDDQQFLDQYHHLPRHYIDRMIKDATGEVDHVHGLRYDSEFKEWAIGDSIVQFEGPDINIKNTLYTGTPGLYELLVLKKPHNYSFKDSQSYKDILLATNAYKRNYDPRQQIMGTKSHKYVNIVKPLLSEHFGAGVKEVNNKQKEYVYWNTPHELVERLRLLHASQAAGHTGHNNEILSIEEELREEGIIA